MAAIVTCDTLRVRIWLCQSRAGAKTHSVLVRFRASHWLRMIEFSRFFEPESLGYKPPRPDATESRVRKFEQRWRTCFENACIYSLRPSESKSSKSSLPECVSRGAQKPRGFPIRNP